MRKNGYFAGLTKRKEQMDTELLPKDKKQAVAKALLDLNYAATEIAGILGVHRATIYRYKDKPLPEDLQQFATETKSLFSVKQQQILAKILKNIEILADQTNDIRALIIAFEVIKRHTSSLYDVDREDRNRKMFGHA
jgi:transposase